MEKWACTALGLRKVRQKVKTDILSSSNGGPFINPFLWRTVIMQEHEIPQRYVLGDIYRLSNKQHTCAWECGLAVVLKSRYSCIIYENWIELLDRVHTTYRDVRVHDWQLFLVDCFTLRSLYHPSVSLPSQLSSLWCRKSTLCVPLLCAFCSKDPAHWWMGSPRF